MQFKTTLILVILLGVLGGFVYLMRDRAPGYEEVKRQQQAMAEGKPVFEAGQISAAQVGRITLATQDQQAVFQKSGNDWRQVLPVAYPLTSWMVDDLVTEAISLKYTEQFTPGQGDYPALDKLGLDAALATITLHPTSEDGKPITLAVGRTILGGKAYVRVQGRDMVYVVTDALAKQLTDDPVARLRRRALEVPTESQADQVTYQQAGHDALVMKKTQGRWQFDQPGAGRVSRQTIATLLTTLGSTSVQKFVADAPDDLSRYGLASPVVTFGVLSSKTDPKATGLKPVMQTLKIGGPVDLANSAYYALWVKDQDKPAIVTLPGEILAKFTLTTDQWRDPALTTLKTGDVRHLAIGAFANRPVRFTRGVGGWGFDDPDLSYRADDGVVAGLVDALTSAKATAFMPDAHMASMYDAWIELTALGQSEPIRLQLWPAQDDAQGNKQWLVIPKHETVGMIVPAKALEKVFDEPWQFRDRQVANLRRQRVHRIELRQPGQPATILTRSLPADASQATATTQPTITDTPSPWQRETEDDQPAINQTLVNALLEAATPVQAQTWLEPGFSPSFKDGAYELRIMSADGEAIVLMMTTQGHALVEGGDQAFVASEALQAAMTSAYGDRQAIKLGHDQIKSISRMMNQQTLTLARNEQGQFVVLSPAMDDMDPNAPQRLVDALSGTQVEQWLAAAPLVEDQTPVASFTITTLEDTHVLLKVYAAREDGLVPAQVGERWFTMASSHAGRLYASMQKQPSSRP